jgi:hypothetical protein
MFVFRCRQKRRKTETTHHHVFADEHLPFDALRRLLNWDSRPVEVASDSITV